MINLKIYIYTSIFREVEDIGEGTPTTITDLRACGCLKSLCYFKAFCCYGLLMYGMDMGYT